MSVVENTLNDNEFFVDTVYTLKEGVKQQRKQECLMGSISNGKMYLLGCKNNRHIKELNTSSIE